MFLVKENQLLIPNSIRVYKSLPSAHHMCSTRKSNFTMKDWYTCTLIEQSVSYSNRTFSDFLFNEGSDRPYYNPSVTAIILTPHFNSALSYFLMSSSSKAKCNTGFGNWICHFCNWICPVGKWVCHFGYWIHRFGTKIRHDWLGFKKPATHLWINLFRRGELHLRCKAVSGAGEMHSH